ncbi:MAG: hypothetical protein KKD24_10400, partial [Proteobacteria bacterium]|nr:hypothetical protein [Pseudomonadota bacterium]
VPREGRFALKSAYLERFWKKSYFDAIEVIHDASEQAGLSMIQIALRWLLRHSFLKGPSGDGVNHCGIESETVGMQSEQPEWRTSDESGGGDRSGLGKSSSGLPPVFHGIK